MKTLSIETRTHGRVLIREVERPRGLLVGFHGYTESADIQMTRLEQMDATAEWTLVSVQALNRFYRGRSEEVVAGWMTRQDREDAIADNIAYVDRVIEAVRRDNQPMVCAGFSQGGAMAFRAATRGRAKAAGVFAVGADVPPELLDDTSLRFPHVLLARGAHDAWYTNAKSDADLKALQLRSASVEQFLYPAAHEWTTDVSAAGQRFLDLTTRT